MELDLHHPKSKEKRKEKSNQENIKVQSIL